jgi:hypothetical protein
MDGKSPSSLDERREFIHLISFEQVLTCNLHGGNCCSEFGSEPQSQKMSRANNIGVCLNSGED